MTVDPKLEEELAAEQRCRDRRGASKADGGASAGVRAGRDDELELDIAAGGAVDDSADCKLHKR